MIQNRQRRVRIPLKLLDTFLVQACEELRVPAAAVTICLVTNREMAKWNRTYRGKNRPTDVLSFPIETAKRPAHGSKSWGVSSRTKRQKIVDPNLSANLKAYLGDIAIAPEVARRNAKEFGRTFGDEMRILILHGILHLMGYDHETDTGQMERRERRLRRVLGLTGSGNVG
jgi:probable rRNA maturation factor